MEHSIEYEPTEGYYVHFDNGHFEGPFETEVKAEDAAINYYAGAADYWYDSCRGN